MIATLARSVGAAALACCFVQCGPSDAGPAVTADIAPADAAPRVPDGKTLDELPPPRVVVVETEPLPIDRLYPSMTGAFDRADIPDDVDWITSIATEVINEDTGASMGGEFFCHSQLEIAGSIRLAVHATGGEELRLPHGCAIPVSRIFKHARRDARDLTYFGMVLNNHFPEIDETARIRATIEYYRDEDVGWPSPLKKLFYRDLTIWMQDIEEYCPPEDGAQVHADESTHCVLVKGENVHWMVPPGQQFSQRTVSNLVPLPSRVHMAQAHLHNYGRWVRLRDLETGEVLWETHAEYMPDRMQITDIPSYSSEEGFMVYPDRDYEIEAFYDNTTDHDVDAMAVIYLYFNPAGNQTLLLPDRWR